MKRYSLLVILHILLLAACSVAACLSFQHHFWFSLVVSFLLLIASGVSLYGLQFRHIRMMRRLIDSIRFNDMTHTFPISHKSRAFKELSEELATALEMFKKHTIAKEVKVLYYENLLEKVDTGVLVTDLDGHIEWGNKVATQIVGNKRQVSEVLQSLPVHDTQIVRLGCGDREMEVVASSSLFSAQGKEQRIITLKNIRSVLERKEMEAWQKLIRVLTHEIMNSITPIISLAETVSERGESHSSLDEEYTIALQAIGVIHRRSKGLLEFVDNYRKLTRLPKPEPAPVSVSELFEHFRRLYPDTAFSFEVADPEMQLMVDRLQLEQVLINLIKNAQEATEKQENPVITVKAWMNDPFNQAVISVKDNGEGMLPEVREKAFVPFFTTKNSGSGIGLSLCKQIITQHGGSIGVLSDLGKGSCFQIVLPIFYRITV